MESKREHVMLALGTHGSGMGRGKEKEQEVEEGRDNFPVEPRPLSLQTSKLASSAAELLKLQNIEVSGQQGGAWNGGEASAARIVKDCDLE